MRTWFGDFKTTARGFLGGVYIGISKEVHSIGFDCVNEKYPIIECLTFFHI